MLTQEQIEIRRTGIGGSDLGTILDISEFKTSLLKIYLSKVDPSKLKKEKPSTALLVGSALESVVVQLYEEYTGLKVEIDDTTYRHKEHNWMIGHIDGWVNNREFILECKTTNSFDENKWGMQFTDEMPKNYYLQCLWYCAILDKPKVDLAVLNKRTEEFRIYTYERNIDIENKVIQSVSKFWHDHILAKVPPKPTTLEEVKLLYPAPTEEQIEEYDDKEYLYVGNEVVAMINEIKQLEDEIKEIKEKNTKKIEKIKVELIEKHLYGHHKIYSSLNEELATYKQQERKTIKKKELKAQHPDIYKKYFETDLFKEDHPDLYEEFLEITTSDVLNIKRKKKQ